MSLRDPFAIFGIEPRFDIDVPALERVHRDLSRAVHPDRVASSAERKGAVLQAMQVNEAFRVLKDPVRRAEALFQLRGVEVGESHEPKPSPAFLMSVLEQREALADARAEKDMAKVAALEAEMLEARAAVEARLTRALSANSSEDIVRAALPALGELRFYRRFLEEIGAIRDEQT